MVWSTVQRVEETSPRLEGLLLPSIADVSVLSLNVSHEAIRIDLCSTTDGAACPDCGSESTRVHSSYLRFPADVPSGGRLVIIRLRVRRFFCQQSSCARRTFAAQLPGLTRRHSRWTERLRSTLAAVGLALDDQLERTPLTCRNGPRATAGRNLSPAASATGRRRIPPLRQGRPTGPAREPSRRLGGPEHAIVRPAQ